LPSLAQIASKKAPTIYTTTSSSVKQIKLLANITISEREISSLLEYFSLQMQKMTSVYCIYGKKRILLQPQQTKERQKCQK
jgi:hypothetical protein